MICDLRHKFTSGEARPEAPAVRHVTRCPGPELGHRRCGVARDAGGDASGVNLTRAARPEKDRGGAPSVSERIAHLFGFCG